MATERDVVLEEVLGRLTVTCPPAGYQSPEDLEQAIRVALAGVFLGDPRETVPVSDMGDDEVDALVTLALDLPTIADMDKQARLNAKCPRCLGTKRNVTETMDVPCFECDGEGWV